MKKKKEGKEGRKYVWKVKEGWKEGPKVGKKDKREERRKEERKDG